MSDCPTCDDAGEAAELGDPMLLRVRVVLMLVVLAVYLLWLLDARRDRQITNMRYRLESLERRRAVDDEIALRDAMRKGDL